MAASSSFWLYWNWEDMCGPGGLTLWSVGTHDIGICFQELCLQVPVFILMATISAYYCGRQTHWIVRSRRQLQILGLRAIATVLMAVATVARICTAIALSPGSLQPVDYLLAAVEGVTWLVHLGFILALRHRLGVSLRGPFSIRIVWALNFALSAISVHSHILLLQSIPMPDLFRFIYISSGFSIADLVLQCVYMITLFPSERSWDVGRYEGFDQHFHNSESQSLLGSPRLGTYSRFREERDPLYLGTAMENAPFCSKLLFHWVTPLMEKGAKKKLENSEDLYDLPVNLTPAYLCSQLEMAMVMTSVTKKHYSDSDTAVNVNGITESEHEIPDVTWRRAESQKPVSLLRALHTCFGIQFYSIGVLKFMSDVTGFMGPLLLNKLVTFIETKSESLLEGYLYAAGLCAVTLIVALCDAHFNFFMQEVGLKIRGALVTTIYRKTLTLSSIELSKFSIGEIVNFMSTDTDRIVNSCPSFHSFWSIPFQIGVSFYLLYTQVGLAFLAGATFTIILIPINKYIASKIGELSTKLMLQKDGRVKVMAEILRGIRVIKFHVWEDHFVDKIGKLRELELKYLRGRKYLDALCVYFWATTPVLISIFTFVTYVLLGNKLTAATVFTSIALLNMLIGPLNAFPWVLNGLTEAWVSLKRIQRLLEGQFIGVMGAVGTGKSSLLSALLAELNKESGIIALSDLDKGFGFVTQQPWLQRGTIRENILFGKSFEHNKYKSIIEACCLVDDFNMLPDGDITSIGDGGVTLSGGQKARVALARAVYQDKNIYFLDDIMSAVDVNVARHIFHKCINGLLRTKTRFLCTHHIQYLLCADHILVMENGRITQQGKPTAILSDYDDYLSPSEFDIGDSSYSHKENAKIIRSDTDTASSTDSILEEEEREEGSVHMNVYLSYLRAIGYLLSGAILLSILLMQSSRNITDWWLSYWVNHDSVNVHNETNTSLFSVEALMNSSEGSVSYYLTVYAVFAVLNSVFTLFRAFLFAYGGIHAATDVHKQMLKTIIKATVTFFDVSPLGRILNRFSSDTYTVDDSLPFIMNILLAQFSGLLGTIIIMVYGLPWMILVLAPLVPVYHWLQELYRLTSRELKRLSSVTLSPVYNHFSETLLGLPTIRSLRAVPRFKRKNEENLEANQKCQYASQAAGRWLGLRLQFIGVAMVTGIGVIAMLQHQFNVADPGLIGLAISYALAVTGLLSAVVNAFTETEKEMIAVERVCQYIDQIELENSREIIAPPYAWPSQGVVTFTDVVLRYREHLAPSLKGVSFTTRPAEKIGVVGRTGAGKSSLFMALFRLTELSAGEILIDTVNIAHIGLTSLRSRFAIIPQEPFLFCGTVGENIDPLDEYRDAELLGALQRCHLSNAINRLGGLGAQVGHGGHNLSVGQRQLLCLVRAVLHNAKILCIDEATANVDAETDRHIQRTLRTSFQKSTVITIAHRVCTVMDSDRVLVMGDGEVLEFDCPDVLLQNKESYFYKLAHKDFH
ncbi:multidrug resistance-associated protein 7 isoform X3 [Zootermopsis nevadensis]|uniref:multidrug resistance-associated protein 7 isoform X3 n=1 Tax=Zootermopsis nevadensis TaxID=136037 RepID=UPI000B8EA8E5|nr:multidrug resistance-associated protein 7 isoform X3 [Zootermopsis nevadensis]